MSSAVYIEMGFPIDWDNWCAFCDKHHIQHSPHTVGGNTFYYEDISLMYEPKQITISTYWMGNLTRTASIARLVLSNYQALNVNTDPELLLFLYPLTIGDDATLGEMIEILNRFAV